MAPEFTSHNVALPDGTQTAPGLPLLAGTEFCKSVLHDLWLLTDGTRTKDVTVADLGCLEGGYTAELARHGYTAEGIEADEDNFACCLRVARALGLPNLAFTHADVRDYVPGRRWDAILCSGLLYHLDQPAKFLRQLGQATRRLLVVNSHYAPHPVTEHEGYPGAWVGEPLGETRWSSRGNAKSFWMTRQAVVHCLREEAGFPVVFEQLDHMQDGAIYVDHHGKPYDNRSVLVAVKP